MRTVILVGAMLIASPSPTATNETTVFFLAIITLVAMFMDVVEFGMKLTSKGEKK